MFRPSNRLAWLALGIFAVTVSAMAVMSARESMACPFCSSINLTFAEQLESNDVVVIAKLLEIPPPPSDPDQELPKAKFEVVSVLKGEKIVAAEMNFRALLVGRHEVGEEFLVMGVDPPNVAWSTPMKASERVVNYISKLGSLPAQGEKRLIFFQDYFEDEESVLAFDAYDEFARAPYEDLIAMKEQMNREQLIAWIKSKDTSINRRRLYFTMLGVCGTEKDAEMLEGFIKSGDRKQQAGLDALIACFLNLRGEEGVGLIEETFLKNREVEYVDTLAAVSALRFHGTEMKLIPKSRIVAAVRQLLDRPKMADMIIPDLARWEDWSVMEKLVQMFKDADEESNWIRVPVITYLRTCPRPEAKKYIEELAKIDPEAVKRADYFLDFDMDTDDGADDDDGEDDGAADLKKEDGKDSSSDPENEGPVEATYTSLASPSVDSPSLDSPSDFDELDSSELDSSELDSSELDSNSLETRKFVALKVPAELNGGLIDSENTVTGVTEDDSELVELNPGATEFVSSKSIPSMSDPIVDQVVQVLPMPAPAPIAATSGPKGLTAMVVFVPMLACVLIFLLLWSVISGWFQRLIV